MPGRAFQIAIADSGIPSPTKQTVADVRHRWQAEPERFESWFDEIAEVVTTARSVIEQGLIEELGPLFDRNQALLAQIGVSLPILEELIGAAKLAGAFGAKLSGGGGGGNIIALVDERTAAGVKQALLQAGARRVLVTGVGL